MSILITQNWFFRNHGTTCRPRSSCRGLPRSGWIPTNRPKIGLVKPTNSKLSPSHLNTPKLVSCTDLKTESSHSPKLGFHSHTSKLSFHANTSILSACLLLIQLQGYRKFSGKLKPLNPILVSVTCRPYSITIRYPVARTNKTVRLVTSRNVSCWNKMVLYFLAALYCSVYIFCHFLSPIPCSLTWP